MSGVSIKSPVFPVVGRLVPAQDVALGVGDVAQRAIIRAAHRPVSPGVDGARQVAVDVVLVLGEACAPDVVSIRDVRSVPAT